MRCSRESRAAYRHRRYHRHQNRRPNRRRSCHRNQHHRHHWRCRRQRCYRHLCRRLRRRMRWSCHCQWASRAMGLLSWATAAWLRSSAAHGLN